METLVIFGLIGTAVFVSYKVMTRGDKDRSNQSGGTPTSNKDIDKH